MNKLMLFVGLGVLAAGQGQAAPATAAQQQALSARAKAFTGHECASVTAYQELPGSNANAFQQGIKLTLDFQKSHGIKSIKQAQSANLFQQQAQQGSKQQYIFQSISGGKTLSGACILK